MAASIPGLKHDYYGALVHEAKVGPRRELTLAIELWPAGQARFRPGDGSPITIRFGGIQNSDEVSRFFAVARPDGLHYLRHAPGRPRKAGSLAIEIEFDRSGDRLTILCRNVSVGP